MMTEGSNRTDDSNQATDAEGDGPLEGSHVEFSVSAPTLGRVLELVAVLMMELEPRRVNIVFVTDHPDAAPGG